MEEPVAIIPESTSSVEGPHNSEYENARYWQDRHQILTLFPNEVII